MNRFLISQDGSRRALFQATTSGNVHYREWTAFGVSLAEATVSEYTAQSKLDAMLASGWKDKEAIE